MTDYRDRQGLSPEGYKVLQKITDLEPDQELVYATTKTRSRHAMNGAAEAYDRGLCELAQRRTKPGVDKVPGTFDYIAIRRKKVVAPRFALGVR